MKKVVAKEVSYCDKCRKEASYVTSCMRCHIEHCYDCKKEAGVEYTHGVYFSGSDDGYYCRACDNELTKSGTDKLHEAYLGIKRLRAEADAWTCDFDRRKKKAEEAVRSLQVKR